MPFRSCRLSISHCYNYGLMTTECTRYYDINLGLKCTLESSSRSIIVVFSPINYNGRAKEELDYSRNDAPYCAKDPPSFGGQVIATLDLFFVSVRGELEHACISLVNSIGTKHYAIIFNEPLRAETP